MSIRKEIIVQTINAAVDSQLPISEIDTELILLNKLYGEKVPLLLKKQPFKCACGYEEDIIPYEKILKGQYKIESRKVTNIDENSRPINSYQAICLVFRIKCYCNEDNEARSPIGLEQMLSLLRQERDFVEKGVKRPHDAYTV